MLWYDTTWYHTIPYHTIVSQLTAATASPSSHSACTAYTDPRPLTFHIPSGWGAMTWPTKRQKWQRQRQWKMQLQIHSHWPSTFLQHEEFGFTGTFFPSCHSWLDTLSITIRELLWSIIFHMDPVKVHNSWTNGPFENCKISMELSGQQPPSDDKNLLVELSILAQMAKYH